MIVVVSFELVKSVPNGRQDCKEPKYEHLQLSSRHPRQPRREDSRLKVADAALIQFGAMLWNKTTPGDLNNTIMSPISVHHALAMVVSGAKQAGLAHEELLSALRYDHTKRLAEDYRQVLKLLTNERVKQPVGCVVVEIRSLLISASDRNYNATYLDTTKNYYNNTPELCPRGDLKTIKRLSEKINSWAREAAYDGNMLTYKELAENPSLLVLSAVNFQSSWFHDFKREKREKIFYNHGKKVVSGDVLSYKSHLGFGSYVEFNWKHSRPKQARFDVQLVAAMKELIFLNFRTVDIPLNHNLSFTLIEPGTGQTLARLASSLTSVSKKGNIGLQTLIPFLETIKKAGDLKELTFPVFKVASSIDLTGPLKELGVKMMFNKTGGLLDGINDHPDLFVSKIKHVATMKADSFGLNAHSIAEPEPSRAPQTRPGRVQVHIKNPFMFLIRHKTSLLFVGQVVEI